MNKDEQERDLLKRIVNGDYNALGLIVRKYTPVIYPYLLAWIKDAQWAEELAQDVFLRLWEKREKLSEVENFGGYIYIISRNIAFSALDKKLTEMEELQTEPLQELLSHTHNPLETKELNEILERGIASLPPRRQEVFLLSRRENITYEAIAERLQISRSAVRQHIVEALVFLRHYVKQHAGVVVSLLAIFLRLYQDA